MARGSQAQAVRTRGGNLHTALRVYDRTDDGRTVTLIAMSHVGDRSYYQRVSDRIAAVQNAGGVVHYEAVWRVEDADMSTATDRERDAVQAVQEIKERQRRDAITTRLAYQVEALPIGEDWQHVDGDPLSYVRLLGPENFLRTRRPLPDLDTITTAQSDGLHLRMRQLGKVARLGKRLMARVIDMRVQCFWRESRAVLAALATPPGTPVVSIWGAAHLPGIGELLERNGFTLTSEEWITAIGKIREPEPHPVSDLEPTQA